MAPFQLFVVAVCAWLHREQTDLIAFLREENRVLKSRLGGRRLRFEDDERRRLGELGRRLLAQVSTVVTPDTILRWHRELVARKSSVFGTAWNLNGRKAYRVSGSHNLPRYDRSSTIAACGCRWHPATPKRYKDDDGVRGADAVLTGFDGRRHAGREELHHVRMPPQLRDDISRREPIGVKVLGC